MGLDCQSRKEQQNTRPIAQNYITAYSQGYYPAFKKKTNSNVERSEAFQLSNVIKSSLFRLFRLSCQTRFPIPVSQSSRSLSEHQKIQDQIESNPDAHFFFDETPIDVKNGISSKGLVEMSEKVSKTSFFWIATNFKSHQEEIGKLTKGLFVILLCLNS